MFLSDRFIKGTCPKCGAEDQNGDNCGVCGASYNVLDVKKPISIISNTVPIKKESEHIFFDLPQKNKMLKDFLLIILKKTFLVIGKISKKPIMSVTNPGIIKSRAANAIVAPDKTS